MEPIEYLTALRRRWRLVLATVAVGLVAAWLSSPGRPSAERSFRASHVLAPDPALQSAALSRAETAALARQVQSVAVFARTGEVPKRVAARLGHDANPAALANRVSVTTERRDGTVTVSVLDDERRRAVALADAFAEELVRYLQEQAEATRRQATDLAVQELETLKVKVVELGAQLAGPRQPGSELIAAERDAAVRQYSVAYERVQQLGAAGRPTSSGLVTIEPATAEPVAQTGLRAPASRTSRAAAGGLIGLALGLVLAVMVDRFDPRLVTRTAAESAVVLPVLAEIPRVRRRERGGVVVVSGPRSAASEAYRMLRGALVRMPAPALTADGSVASPDQPERQVVVVTSPGTEEGKTTTVANLAACFAEAGRSVLVLDCDLRNPAAHRHLDAARAPGVSDVVGGGPDSPLLSEVTHVTGVPRVRLIPAGTPVANPAELLPSLRHLVFMARQMADVVLLDAPPLLATNDVTELVAEVDALVLVVRAGRTTKSAASRASQLLARIQAPAVGVALVEASSRGPGARPTPPRTALGHRRDESRAVEPKPAERRPPARVGSGGRRAGPRPGRVGGGGRHAAPRPPRR